MKTKETEVKATSGGIEVFLATSGFIALMVALGVCAFAPLQSLAFSAYSFVALQWLGTGKTEG